jgi:hypothetical protein
MAVGRPSDEARLAGYTGVSPEANGHDSMPYGGFVIRAVGVLFQASD